MKDTIQFIEQKLIDDANNFISAGEILFTSKECCVENQMFLTQIIFMNRHACELLLKALIFRLLKNNCEVENVKNIKLEDVYGKKSNKSILDTHSILKLYDTFLSMSTYNLLIDKDRLLKNRKMAIEIDKIDEDSTYFRYPIDKDGNFNKRTYFIDPEDPNICPDFNNYSIDSIFIDQDEGIVKYINIVPEAIEFNKKLIKFYDFLKDTQVSF